MGSGAIHTTRYNAGELESGTCIVTRFVCDKLVIAGFHEPFGELAHSRRYPPTFAALVQVSSPFEVKEVMRSCAGATAPTSTAAATRKNILFKTCSSCCDFYI